METGFLKKKICVVATGGTIASRAKNTMSTEGYELSAFSAGQLVEQISGIGEIADVSVEEFCNKSSTVISEEDLVGLSERINTLLNQENFDGIVVTHGTDTLEETAFFLQLTVDSAKPVVVTGSMRPATVISADGALNLYNAVCCAASDASVGMGVTVCMNDLILSSRDVVKFSTFQTDAFQAPFYGLLGTVRNSKVSYAYKPIKRHTFMSEFAGKTYDVPFPKVEILYMYQGCSNELFESAVSRGCRGIVTAGMGNGWINRRIQHDYEEDSRELPVLIRSARVPTGGVSDSRVLGPKIIVSGDLNPQKAYILLKLALSVTDNPSEISRIFAEY